MEGWIKLHRSIKKHWVFQDSEYFKYWIYLLLDVNHEDKKIVWNKELIEIKRGQKITSLQKLAKEFNCSREKVRRFLDLLKKDTMIDIDSNTRYTQITICNYDNYQTEQHTNNTRTTHEKNTQKTPTDINKNVKNVKNILDRELIFKKEVEMFQDKYSIDMLKNFFIHWSEPNQNKSKMKFELEKTWDTKRRLARWYNNGINWKK